MTVETKRWLNENVLVGFENLNGKAWHFDPSVQPDEPNHYPAAVPKADVLRRLFSWEAVERSVLVDPGDGSPVTLDDYKAIVHGQTSHVFKIARKNYEIHQYSDWLLGRVSDILDNGDLEIANAGLLAGGAKAWVSIKTPETLRSRSGMEIQPQLLAATSHDSSLASVFKMVQTIVVCDNTLSMALSEHGSSMRVRHTKSSVLTLSKARDALDLIIASGGTTLSLLDRLAQTSITANQFERIIQEITPIPEDTIPRVRARLENTQSEYRYLYTEDPRCAPWQGTALGVFQVFNTHRLYFAGTDKNRFERNMTATMTYAASHKDSQLIKTISDVAGASLINSK